MNARAAPSSRAASIYTVGLTGGIGSGKSTAAALFAQHGAAVIDTDDIAHRLTAPGQAATAAIARAFGGEYLTAAGGLDRARMRATVFADAGARRRLEAILHPAIHAQAAAELRALGERSDAPYAVAVVPLLVESADWGGAVDRVLVVDCAEALQIERARQRGLQLEEVHAIMAAQAGRAQRTARADDILSNEAGMPALASAVASLHEAYLGYAARAATGT